jgi:SM-20-related protein
MDNQEVTFELIIDAILTRGYSISDDFLNNTEIENLYQSYENNALNGLLDLAGIGKKSEQHQNKEIRGDKILWIEPNTTNIHEIALLLKIQTFIDYLNSTCYLGIKRSEFHYANYEIGKYYKRHRDSFQNQKGRIFSVIIYLNKNYQIEDGGDLVLYPFENNIETTLNINPIAGRMVCFESEKLDHEVLETFKNRVSITGWFLNN